MTNFEKIRNIEIDGRKIFYCSSRNSLVNLFKEVNRCNDCPVGIEKCSKTSLKYYENIMCSENLLNWLEEEADTEEKK